MEAKRDTGSIPLHAQVIIIGGELHYMLTDHLGSVVAVTDADGVLESEQRYLPFGQVRTDVGCGVRWYVPIRGGVENGCPKISRRYYNFAQNYPKSQLTS